MTASAKPPLALRKRLLTSNQLKQPKIILGQAGEQRAAAFLTSQHYQILDQNISFAAGELDIVALDTRRQEIVFVEVKTRRSAKYGAPSTAVNFRKRRALYAAASQYLKVRQLAHPFRFDIISVLPDRLDHIENISW